MIAVPKAVKFNSGEEMRLKEMKRKWINRTLITILLMVIGGGSGGLGPAET